MTKELSVQTGGILPVNGIFNSPHVIKTGINSFLSQLCHFFGYSLEKPMMQLENGMLIISIDVDVGGRKLGLINEGKNDANIRRQFSEYSVGEIEERALPLFVDLFENFEIPVTFAVRGQLTEVSDSILGLLCKSSVKHDIGAHGYFHKTFPSLSTTEAEHELKMIQAGMKKFGIVPRSFVFPKNKVAHLRLLEKYGYNCYRGKASFMTDSMYIEKRGELYHVHSSLHIDQYTRFLLFKNIFDRAITNKLPFHVWFHLWDFGESKKTIQKTIKKAFVPLLKYAKNKEKNGSLTFETMFSAAKRVEKSLLNNE